MEIRQTNQLILENENLKDILKSFLLVKKSENRSPATIRYYEFELTNFLDWLSLEYEVTTISGIEPSQIRHHLSELANTRNKGGVHARYRAIKAFLNFYSFEYEPNNWHNPIDKIRVSTPETDPIKGVDIADVRKLINVCRDDNLALRDKAIFLCLLTSGLRASEFLSLNVSDIDLITGQVNVINGKGNKSRIAFLSREAKKTLRSYLRTRKYLDSNSPVWATCKGEKRLLYSGLRSIVRRRSKQANVKQPKLHDFRRTFALEAHRSNMPILIISKLLGHNQITTTTRYLRLDENDLRESYIEKNLFG